MIIKNYPYYIHPKKYRLIDRTHLPHHRIRTSKQNALHKNGVPSTMAVSDGVPKLRYTGVLFVDPEVSE